MKYLRCLALVGMFCATPVLADEAGDLVFTERGPWQLAEPLVWSISQSGP